MLSNILNLAADEAGKGEDAKEVLAPIKDDGSAAFFGGDDTFFKAVANLFGGLANALKPIIQTGLEWAGIVEIPNIFQ